MSFNNNLTDDRRIPDLGCGVIGGCWLVPQPDTASAGLLCCGSIWTKGL